MLEFLPLICYHNKIIPTDKIKQSLNKKLIIKPNKTKAIMLAKRQLPEFVCDAVNLEGINFTLPEIITLLDGITVGGHKISDQQIALNQADTWRALFKLIQEFFSYDGSMSIFL